MGDANAPMDFIPSHAACATDPMLKGEDAELIASAASASAQLDSSSSSDRLPSPNQFEQRRSSPILVVMSGIQGSGKSALCKLLGSIFRGSIWVNQDETSKNGSPRRKFLD